MAIIKDGKKYRTLEEQVYYLTHFKDNVYNKNEVYTKQETNSLVDEKDLLVKNEIKETTYTKEEVNALINQAIAKVGGKTLLYEGELDLSSSQVYPSINIDGYDTYFIEAKIKGSSNTIFAKGYGYFITSMDDVASDVNVKFITFMLTSANPDTFGAIQFSLRAQIDTQISTSTNMGLEFHDGSGGVPYIQILDGEVVGKGFKNLIITKIYGVK